MRRLLDINTWLALIIEGHSQHSIARGWYVRETCSPGDLLFCRQTEMGVLRLLSQQRVMETCAQDALTNAEASAFLSQILRDEIVGTVGEAPGTRALWLALARNEQPSPNIWMDAYLAALAITNDLTMLTFDKGFVNYQDSGLRLQLL